MIRAAIAMHDSNIMFIYIFCGSKRGKFWSNKCNLPGGFKITCVESEVCYKKCDRLYRMNLASMMEGWCGGGDLTTKHDSIYQI